MNDNNEEEIRRLLEKCCDAAMESLDEEPVTEDDYVPTRRFEKRMKRMLWSEKHFGHRLRLGYAVRRAAVFLIILAGVLGSATVSAKVFDFRPWEYLPGYDWFVTDEVDDLPTDYHDEDPVVATPKPKPTAKPTRKRAYPTATPNKAVSGEAVEVTDGNETTPEEDAAQEPFTDDPRKSTDEPSATEPGSESGEDPRKEEEPRESDPELSEESEDEDEDSPQKEFENE